MMAVGAGPAGEELEAVKQANRDRISAANVEKPNCPDETNED
jgi:hypothetical protein